MQVSHQYTYQRNPVRGPRVNIHDDAFQLQKLMNRASNSLHLE